MDGLERDFFAKIKKAVFANPFGATRAAVDLELTGMSKSSSNDQILARLMEEVVARISKYKDDITYKNKSLSAEELDLLRYGVLFYTFHHHCASYDRLIDRQIEQGAKPCRVDFADEVLQFLYTYGFSQAEALRYFSLFFQLRRAFYFINNIAGKSHCVTQLRKSLWNNIFTCDVGLYETYLWNRMEDFSTILLGETGTGKGMAAGAIGRSGFIQFDEKTKRFADSFAQTFISINLSQYSESLIESELFGHRKGAFTGAVDSFKGVFSRCSPHGAIFLDEIGEVSIPVQIKLLQVLQERLFTPVGSHRVEKFEGRVIAATNQPIDELRKQGKFRDDFYYRLCSDTIEVPPLRKRLAEHPGELREILSRTVGRILGYSSEELTAEIEQLIEKSQPHNYHWPGNIRELEQCVRQMLLNRCYSWSETSQSREKWVSFQEKYQQGQFSAREILSHYCSLLYEQHGTQEKVAKLVQLDRRTVKKYLQEKE